MAALALWLRLCWRPRRRNGARCARIRSGWRCCDGGALRHARALARPVAWGSGWSLLAGRGARRPAQALAAPGVGPRPGRAARRSSSIGWVASIHERRAASWGGARGARGVCAPTPPRWRRCARRRWCCARAPIGWRLSLTFLRDVARRIDGGDSAAAAQAALELAPRAWARARGRSDRRRRAADAGRCRHRGAWDAAASAGHDARSAEALRCAGRRARSTSRARAAGDSDLAAPDHRRQRDGRGADVAGVPRVPARPRSTTWRWCAEWLATAVRARAGRGG